MEALAWTAIALLGAAVLGSFGSFFYLGTRIDALGARLDSKIDGLSDRLDAQTGRIDAQAVGSTPSRPSSRPRDATWPLPSWPRGAS
jgi:hypothetical protein